MMRRVKENKRERGRGREMELNQDGSLRKG